MRKEVDGEYGKSAFIETRAERIVPMTRRLARPYFRVGLILSVCLSVCLEHYFKACFQEGAFVPIHRSVLCNSRVLRARAGGDVTNDGEKWVGHLAERGDCRPGYARGKPS